MNFSHKLYFIQTRTRLWTPTLFLRIEHFHPNCSAEYFKETSRQIVYFFLWNVSWIFELFKKSRISKVWTLCVFSKIVVLPVVKTTSKTKQSVSIDKNKIVQEWTHNDTQGNMHLCLLIVFTFSYLWTDVKDCMKSTLVFSDLLVVFNLRPAEYWELKNIWQAWVRSP